MSLVFVSKNPRNKSISIAVCARLVYALPTQVYLCACIRARLIYHLNVKVISGKQQFWMVRRRLRRRRQEQHFYTVCNT